MMNTKFDGIFRYIFDGRKGSASEAKNSVGGGGGGGGVGASGRSGRQVTIAGDDSG